VARREAPPLTQPLAALPLAYLFTPWIVLDRRAFGDDRETRSAGWRFVGKSALHIQHTQTWLVKMIQVTY